MCSRLAEYPFASKDPKQELHILSEDVLSLMKCTVGVKWLYLLVGSLYGTAVQ